MFTNQMYQCPIQPIEAKWKPNAEIAPNCPRCASPNTKFCYYNNYSLSQPRYFCKGCRRYWTKGGSLRNVPVGGGCRKNRRAKRTVKSVSFRSGYEDLSTNNNNSSVSGADSVFQSDAGDIDLADVFSKFLNSNGSSSDFQPSDVGNSEMGVDLLSNSLAPDSDAVVVECQSQSDKVVFDEQGINLVDVFSPFFDQKQEESDMNLFQTWLGDEEVQGVAAEEQSLTWQFQELGYFNGDDDVLLNNSDNWNSFDLSGFEIYSRP